jgi:hypothetical protein
MTMPAKKTSKKKLSLKPVEKKLQEILKALEKQLQRKGLTKQQQELLKQDIDNVKGIIAGLPGGCHKVGPYDLGI